MSHPVMFVSLGPGDPELVTLKALAVLRGADAVFCPAAGGGSRSAAILSALDISPARVRAFPVPMSGDRSAAAESYRRAAEEVTEAWRSGLAVAVAAEGDAGFYATTEHIAVDLSSAGVPWGRVAGVPAFLACAAWAGVAVARRDEGFEVVPGTLSAGSLGAKLAEGRTVVVMKASRCAAAVKHAAATLPGAEFHYFENAGVAGKEFHTSDRAVILAREFPYFSLVIVRPAP